MVGKAWQQEAGAGRPQLIYRQEAGSQQGYSKPSDLTPSDLLSPATLYLLKVPYPPQTAITGDHVQIHDPVRAIPHSNHHAALLVGSQ